jgi:tetratricopeptide (TPR) repeat protein
MSTHDALFQEAAEALSGKEYARAERLQRQGLELLRAQPTDEWQIARELEKLASIHFVQAKFVLAASEYDQALKIYESLLPENGAEVLQMLYWLAKSQFNSQKYELAEATLRRALSAAETKGDSPDSPDSLALYSYELGFLLYFVGRYQEAESYLLRALALYETTKGISHPWTVEILERLALTYSQCAEIGKDPEPYFRKAVEVIKPEGEMRQTYVENLVRLAEHVAERRRFEEADALYSQILKVLDDSAQPGQVSEHWVASSCVEYFRMRGKGDLIAHLAAREASYDGYGEMVRTALEHAEQKLSEDDPKLGEALFNAGNNAIFRGTYEEAEKLLHRALNARRKVYGDESEPVAEVLIRICVVSRLLKKFDEADKAVQQALDMSRRRFAALHVFPASLENLAMLREAQARTAEAARLYEEAVAEYERIHGFPSHETAEALYRQSAYLLRTGEPSPAETTIRRAVSVMDEIETLSDYEKSDYLVVLASVLEATGRDAEAAEIQKRAQELYARAPKEADRDA